MRGKYVDFCCEYALWAVGAELIPCKKPKPNNPGCFKTQPRLGPHAILPSQNSSRQTRRGFHFAQSCNTSVVPLLRCRSLRIRSGCNETLLVGPVCCPFASFADHTRSACLAMMLNSSPCHRLSLAALGATARAEFGWTESERVDSAAVDFLVRTNPRVVWLAAGFSCVDG